MNLRCAFCQTPYALGRTEMLAGLQMMEAENLSHYDAHCPRCRRVTQIPRQRLEMAFPNWKAALNEAVSQAPAAEAAAASSAAKPAEPEKAKPASKAKAGADQAASRTVVKAPSQKAPRHRTGRK